MALFDRIRLSPEVAAAAAAGHPLVALETTIVTHGMPWPENVATALGVEEVVRAAGAVPATIAIIDGEIRVGLSADELEALAKMTGVMKLSRADLAFALATRRPGATTVAATMIAAHLAGIRIFATGGIGGVHRGAETSFDVSADLYELAETPVTVVSAGAKALLDIPKTLEVLETLGVPVVTLGQDALPAFWSRDSGLPSPLRLDDAASIATFMATREELGLKGGMLIANPVPEADEIPAAEMRVHIEQATEDAARAGIRAKAVTPFVLGRMLELTGGRSLATNIALVRNNARLAAEIAVALQANDG
ncbi:pseudouridine-5'-phosphate glycosidase [Kaistia geumhonensis]|uniref:Pseudouridine-5'-phosphate glycosidase n=1 Tax=Kaistia geumhonensis TaxID=410839 RepID=A0ABU0MC84_9HYPH|nr:pseudouridine-5'-phosphate glycosidase [Kaistia geumhonensis]MCX5481499.1 pseudouridine-5'-phosphate glycosidase [Kaistia geumhonensis]MDQ0518564.1 pseudouridine-5'-phosphate glycosidase [Kaistia geumhonensis]